MAISHVGTFASNAVTTAGTTNALNYTTVTLGDIVMVTSATSSATVGISTLSGGGVTTWNKIVLLSGNDLWWGKVTTVGAVTLTATYSASISASSLSAEQYTNGTGSGTAWSLVTSASHSGASSTTMTYDAMTATAAGQLWFGYAVPSTAGSAGSTSGFTYQVDNATFSAVIAYSVLGASGAVTPPTAPDSPAGTYVTVGAIMAASSNVSLTAADTAAASDSTSRAALTRTRTVADSAAAADAVARSLSLAARSATDTASAADTVVRYAGKMVSDTATASDVATRAPQTFTRKTGDISGRRRQWLTQDILGLDILVAPLPMDGQRAQTTFTARDTAAAVDSTGRVNALVRPVADTAAAADALARTTALPRAVSDTASAVDTVGPPVVYRAVNASPNWPLMGFEVDFTTGPPNLPGLVRKSINAAYRRLFVRRWNTSRGRQYELDQVQAGTATLETPDPLDLLNPDNTSSAFNTGSNQVTPYRAMQIWGMWPNQPGSGNIINTKVASFYDPSFESGVGNWVGTGGSTVAQSTAQAFDGTHSMLVTQSAAGFSYGANNVWRTAPGITYTFSAYVYATAGCTVQMQVNLADGTTATSNTTSAAAWTRLSVTWLTVDTLETVTVFGSGTATPTFYVDATMLEFGSVLHPYTSTGPTLYPVFTGYVERFPTSYDMAGRRAQRPLQAVDAAAILARTAISQSYPLTINADKPLIRIDYTEAAAPQRTPGSTNPLGSSSAIQGGQLGWAGDAHLDGTPALALSHQYQTDTAKYAPVDQVAVADISHPTFPVNYAAATIEWWAKWVVGSFQPMIFGLNTVGLTGTGRYTSPWDNNNSAGNYYLATKVTSSGWSLAFAAPGQTELGVGLATSGSFTYDGTTYPDGQWHYYAVTLTPHATNTYTVGITVDGASAAYGSGVTGANLGGIGFNQITSMVTGLYGDPISAGSVGRVAYYTTALTTAQRLTHYQRGTGMIGEKSGARVTRILNSYWSGATSVAAGFAALAPDFSYNGRTVLDVMQEIQETERGLFYVAANGTLTFEDRTSRYNSKTALWVFGENPAGANPTEYPYTDIKFDHDPTFTFSQANLSRPGNTAYPPVINTAAQGKYGQRILTQTAQVNTDFDLSQAGIFYLQRYGTPRTRVQTLVLKPAANPALFPVVLSLELSQRITVTRRTTFTRTADYYIEKIEHSVNADSGEWTVTLQLSPVYNAAAWVLGDTTAGVLGSTTTPIY